MTNPTPYQPTTPALLDRALAGLNGTLTTEVTWLTTAYGAAVRLVEELDSKENARLYTRYFYPAIYTGGVGGKDYLTMFPDEHLAADGGYSWWDVTACKYENGRLEFTGGLVIWLDFRRAYGDGWQGRTVWNAANDVLAALDLSEGVIREYDIQTEGQKVYPNLSHKESDRQFNMMPYGCFRINLTAAFALLDC